MALRKVDTQAVETRLSTLAMPEAPGWTGPARRDALSRVQAGGLPQRRDEYWKYTRPDALIAPEATPAAILEEQGQQIFDAIDSLKIVFVDGVFDAEASDDLAAEGIEIERLAQSQSADIHWARDLYGALEAQGQNPVARPLAALNTAFAEDGLVIRVTGRVERPVRMIYKRRSETSDAMLHHLIRLEPGADMTLLETGPAAARFNNVMEVDVADGAGFHHVRVQGRDHERQAATHIFGRLGEKSTFKSFTLTVNGVLTRNECVVEFTGDDAVAHLAGAAVGDGKDFHDDDTVFVTHGAERCESRQVYKKVLRNGATGVFQGKIYVYPNAQKTDGYQISQSLLLDGDSQFLAKPELEIYADDVVCSHGSTSGAIDDDSLFYLRSRGIQRPEAEDLMTLAFLAEAIEEIEKREVADDLLEQLTAWLSRRRG